MLPWQPTFEWPFFFSENNKTVPLTKMKKNHFSSRDFFLAHISVPLLALITFRSVLALSGSFRRIQKSKMADPFWPPFGNHNLITMSHDVITSQS